VNIICFFDPCFDEERMIQCARLAGMHEQIMAMTPLSYAIAQIPNRLHRFGNFVTKTGSVAASCCSLLFSPARLFPNWPRLRLGPFVRP
jgi:hypothetical protein